LNNRQEIKRGLLWLGSGHALMRALELLSMPVLLWLLSEEDMGLGALSWTVAVVVDAYNGLGLGTAIVQSRSLEKRTLDSAFWFTLGFALVLFAGCAAVSPFVADFFREPRLAPMLVVGSTDVLWAGASIVPRKVLARELRFKELAAAETLSVGVAILVKIALAAAGFGAWALVIGHASESLALLIAVNLVAPFRPSAHFALSDIKTEIRFGIKVAASGIIYNTYRNLDYAVVGRLFGAAALGVYRVAFDIAMSPSMSVLAVVNGAAFPVYSRLAHDPPRLKESFLFTTRNLIILTGPIAVFLAFSAPNLIPLIEHGKWNAAVPVVQVLCWAALFRSLAHLSPQVLHAVGRPDLAVWESVLTLALLSLMFGAAAHFGDAVGVSAIAWGWLLIYPAVLWTLWLFKRRLIGLRLSEYLKSFGAGLAAMGSVALALALINLLRISATSSLVVFLVQLAVALGTMLLFVRYVLGVRPRDVLRPNSDA
jgi:O-antigen/teichoic acid export membrane protein